MTSRSSILRTRLLSRSVMSILSDVGTLVILMKSTVIVLVLLNPLAVKGRSVHPPPLANPLAMKGRSVVVVFFFVHARGLSGAEGAERG